MRAFEHQLRRILRRQPPQFASFLSYSLNVRFLGGQSCGTGYQAGAYPKAIQRGISATPNFNFAHGSNV